MRLIFGSALCFALISLGMTACLEEDEPYHRPTVDRTDGGFSGGETVTRQDPGSSQSGPGSSGSGYGSGSGSAGSGSGASHYKALQAEPEEEAEE